MNISISRRSASARGAAAKPSRQPHMAYVLLRLSMQTTRSRIPGTESIEGARRPS